MRLSKEKPMLHGGNIYKLANSTNTKTTDWLDFSANINPLGTPLAVTDAMKDQLNDLTNYPDPDCTLLCEGISKSEGVCEEFILCGNGAADLIYRLCFAIKPKKVLLPAPTFLEYAQALGAVETKITHYPMEKGFVITESIYDYIKKGFDMIFICNPNNPTGLLTDRNLILSIIKQADKHNTIVVLDECFLDFTGKEEEYSLKNYLNEYKNLIILRSFTKMYALPGIRLGYMMCSNIPMLLAVRQAGQTWSVNTLAQVAGIKALEEIQYKQNTIILMQKEQIYMTLELQNLGFTVYTTAANYLFFYKKDCVDLYDKLLLYGIVIRRCSNYVGLTKEYYRVAIKTHKDNEKLINALKKCKRNQQKEGR